MSGCGHVAGKSLNLHGFSVCSIDLQLSEPIGNETETFHNRLIFFTILMAVA